MGEESERPWHVVTVKAGDRDRAARWVRIACWVGAITDAGACVQMTCPSAFDFAYRPNGFHPGADYAFAMGMGASLMLGWTALLVWATRRPLERSGVLVLTVLPVVLGLAANEVRGVANGFLPVGPLVPVWVLQAGLGALFMVAYVMARRASAASDPGS